MSVETEFFIAIRCLNIQQHVKAYHAVKIIFYRNIEIGFR